MQVRLAARPDLPVVMTVFDSALLAVTAEDVRTAIGEEQVLVAVDDDRVLGAVLLSPSTEAVARIEAVAVRRARRGQGIGTSLVRAAADHYGPLVAEFDAGVRPFWESLGFDVEPAAEPGRYVGRLVGEAEEP